ncbi:MULTISPECIES: Bro-N domain-containing protein [unclassified Pseudomonas]|uniref:BRO-N domain-containing protein n=1 Tax=unclassified Pseudomonas TaxID=196821 RepID=UPI000D38B2B7|nr:MULTISPECIES: Bro-N domain-containing protein [unclassified Pseudomonas]RAU43424.1 hypothetical protein DBP26_019680 [Pseudomonas sp. RIT 409]RAU50039.1 hypothetical protein DBY65_023105 [Pseudomonas sp. RIT 412]
MSDHSTNVIPFNFGEKLVRTMLIGDQPWFVATDVAVALEYRDAFNMIRILDDDEKGTQIVSTLGGGQMLQVINESGLYSAILRSRKSEAKRFKKWITSEVLPAIRKHGRYEDNHKKMPTLMDELIGMSELNVLKGLIRDKAKAVPASMQQSFAMTMHRRLHTRFNVPRTELIPVGQFDIACSFIGSYALEGEYLGKEIDQPGRLNIHQPLDALTCRRPSMLVDRGNGHAWLDVKISDLHENFRSPCELILSELTRAGYDVDGAWWEVRTMRNKLRDIGSFVKGLNALIDEPQRYAIKDGVMA